MADHTRAWEMVAETFRAMGRSPMAIRTEHRTVEAETLRRRTNDHALNESFKKQKRLATHTVASLCQLERNHRTGGAHSPKNEN